MKRINANYHLTQIVSLSKFYTASDMIRALDESRTYNMYSYLIIKAFLEKNARTVMPEMKIADSKNIIKSDVDIKRSLTQYKVF